MHTAALVIDHDEQVRVERARPGGQRQDRLEARAIAREQHDAAEPGLLRQRRDVIGQARSIEADTQQVTGAAPHPASDRPARLATYRSKTMVTSALAAIRDASKPWPAFPPFFGAWGRTRSGMPGTP